MYQDRALSRSEIRARYAQIADPNELVLQAISDLLDVHLRRLERRWWAAEWRHFIMMKGQEHGRQLGR